ncbi:MAG: AAA family ATPase [Nitrospirae bacterium]|nr:AAA family ATPase [Nitrospirota bacterium]MBI5694165.1 AAA family ATPase [Nitrospirota bacterium]
MIRRIYIDGYKSFKDFELTIGPLAVIMGPNATGKSNLLDALALLSSTVTNPTLTKAFSSHRGLPLECIYGWTPSDEYGSRDITFEVDLEIDEDTEKELKEEIKAIRKPYIDSKDDIKHELHGDVQFDSTPQERIALCRQLRYRLVLRVDLKSGNIGVFDEKLEALRKDFTETLKSRNPFVGKSNGKLSLRMEGQAHPRYFDVGIDHTILSTPLYLPHYQHMSLAKREMEKWAFYYFEPREIMRAANPISEVKNIGSRGENLTAFLNTLEAENPKQFASLVKSLAQVLPRVKDILIERTKDGQLLLHVTEEDGERTARVVSEGTLRIIGIASILSALKPANVVGYEEPENGVHPRRIQLLADWFIEYVETMQKQVIITTHSPIFARCFESEQLFVSLWENQRTQIMPFSTFGELFMKQEIDDALEENFATGVYGG